MGIGTYLVLSLAGHAALLALSSQVTFRAAQAARPRYTRVRLVGPSAVPQRQANPRLQVVLPGARVQPAPAGLDLPDADEIQRQMDRIAALRADFFRPMNVVNLPMPVLPGGPPGGPLPPLWGLPLPKDLPILPGLAPLPPAMTSADQQRLAKLLRQAPAPPSAAPRPNMAAPRAAAARDPAAPPPRRPRPHPRRPLAPRRPAAADTAAGHRDAGHPTSRHTPRGHAGGPCRPAGRYPEPPADPHVR